MRGFQRYSPPYLLLLLVGVVVLLSFSREVIAASTESWLTQLGQARESVALRDVGQINEMFEQALNAAGKESQRSETHEAWARGLAYAAGSAARGQDVLQQSVEHYERAIELAPGGASIQTQINHAAVLMMLDRPQLALPILRQVEQRALTGLDASSRARFLYNLGLAHEAVGDFDAAIGAFRLGRQADPGFKQTAEAVFRILIERFDRPAAIQQVAAWADELVSANDTLTVEPYLKDALARPEWMAHPDFRLLIGSAVRLLAVAKLDLKRFEDIWSTTLLRVAEDAEEPSRSMASEVVRAYRDRFPVSFQPHGGDELVSALLANVYADEELGRQLVSDFMTQAGDAFLDVSAKDKALQRYALAWSVYPKNLAAGLFGVNMLLEGGEKIDPERRLLNEAINDLLMGKSDAYQSQDKPNMMRLHVVLGTIFEKKSDNAGKSVLYDALYHWERAVEIFQEIKAQDSNKVDGVPGLHASIARAREALGDQDAAAVQYAEAAEQARALGEIQYARQLVSDGVSLLAQVTDQKVSGRLVALKQDLGMKDRPEKGGGRQAKVKIATAGPMSGQFAWFGEQMQRGAKMAVADLNAAGGVNGEIVVLSIGDDACDPRRAIEVAHQMVGEGVVFMAGHFCSGSSIPASAVYADEGILQISPASTNPAYTEDAAAKGWNTTMRVCGRDDFQGVVTGNYLAKMFGDKKIAILHDKTAYGKGLADETKKNLNKAGVVEAMYEAYTAGEKDYSALVARMKAANIGAIYVGGYHTEAGLIIRQAHEQGYKPQLISGDALVTDEYWKIAGDSGEGTLMIFQPDPRNKPAAKDVVARFRASGYEPEGYTLYTYAAIQVWAAGATEADSFDAEKIADILKSGKTFETVIGPLVFNSKGDVLDPEYVWYIWKDGKYSEM